MEMNKIYRIPDGASHKPALRRAGTVFLLMCLNVPFLGYIVGIKAVPYIFLMNALISGYFFLIQTYMLSEVRYRVSGNRVEQFMDAQTIGVVKAATEYNARRGNKSNMTVDIKNPAEQIRIKPNSVDIFPLNRVPLFGNKICLYKEINGFDSIKSHFETMVKRTN